MATAERPPAKIDGKPNPAYQAWYRDWVKAGKPALEAPEVLTLRAIGGARNTNYVRAALGNGDAVYVRVQRGKGQRLIGKPIKVLVSEEDGDKKYTHIP